MALTEHQIQLVAHSFASIVPVTDAAAAKFYERLWEIAPETRPLFHETDMHVLGIKIMQTLGVVVRALHELDSVSPMLQQLGQRHVGYGATRDQYETVKSALLWMMQQMLGDEYTPEVHEAWNAAYDLIAEKITVVYDHQQ